MASLFNTGGADSNKRPALSLFGSTTTTANAPQPLASIAGSSLFGGLGNTLPTAAATTSAPTASLFGASAANPAPGAPVASLFGASKQPAGNSLFSNLAVPAATNQPAQPAQPSIIGNIGGGLNLPAGQSTNKPAGDNSFSSAYFNSLLEKNKKRARGVEDESGFGQVPSLQLGLGDLARRVRELGGAGTQSQKDRGVDSKAHYLLAASGVNPGTTLKDLHSFNAQAASASFAPQPPEWDPDSHKYVEELQQQTTLKMINEGINRAHRNFDAYLEEHVNLNWEEQRRKVYEHFGLTHRTSENVSDGGVSYPDLSSKGGFGKSSRRGKDNTGTPRAVHSRSIFGQSAVNKSVIGTPGVGAGNAQLFGEASEKATPAPVVSEDRLLREKQVKFAEKVQKLNEARLQETNYRLLQEFASVEGHPIGESPIQLLDAYSALIEIVEESSQGKARRQEHNVIEENPNSEESYKMRKRILEGSRRALEKQFMTTLNNLVARNPKEASLGGTPTVVNRVRAYIRVRNARKDLVPDGMELQMLNDDYCWALIFFLLRGGHAAEAAKYVADNANPFKALDRTFVQYITSYSSSADRKLPRTQQDKINSEYQQRIRMSPENSLDPYRMACYKIIGRCELSKRSIDTISQGVEDWIWLQFALAREAQRAEELATEVYGLNDVRDTIREIGQRHFSKGAEGTGGYGTYFYLQILGGMFEQAIAYLYSHSYVAAVHFAIALNFYNCLRVSDFSASDTDLLTFNTKEQPQINFGRMIGYYTRDFRTGNVVAATDYLTLICLNANLTGQLGKNQAELCHEALRELVLETREFSQLLGDIHADGTRITGAIEQRLKLVGITDQEGFLRTITIQAASVADANGRTTDAVLLYHLAEDYDNVISIINRALSDAIAVDIDAERLHIEPLKPRVDPNRPKDPNAAISSLSLASVDDPVLLAQHFIGLYNDNTQCFQKIGHLNREICGTLLRMSEAKLKVQHERWAEALDIISSLGILPLGANGSIPVIRSHAQNLGNQSPIVSRLVGPLILWTMTSISQQRELLLNDGNSAGTFENNTRKLMREELVIKAKDLMVFAGLVKLRLGKGVWEGIVGGAGEVGVY